MTGRFGDTFFRTDTIQHLFADAPGNRSLVKVPVWWAVNNHDRVVFSVLTEGKCPFVFEVVLFSYAAVAYPTAGQMVGSKFSPPPIKYILWNCASYIFCLFSPLNWILTSTCASRRSLWLGGRALFQQFPFRCKPHYSKGYPWRGVVFKRRPYCMGRDPPTQFKIILCVDICIRHFINPKSLFAEHLMEDSPLISKFNWETSGFMVAFIPH